MLNLKKKRNFFTLFGVRSDKLIIHYTHRKVDKEIDSKVKTNADWVDGHRKNDDHRDEMRL